MIAVDGVFAERIMEWAESMKGQNTELSLLNGEEMKRREELR